MWSTLPGLWGLLQEESWSVFFDNKLFYCDAQDFLLTGKKVGWWKSEADEQTYKAIKQKTGLFVFVKENVPV